MADVFISYKREDRALVEQLSAALRDLDVSAWFDLGLAPGEDWDARIGRELEAAKAVIVCWSPAACVSSWVMREAAVGAHRKVLLPVKVAPCEVPSAFAAIHVADLIGWEGDIGDQRLQAILSPLGRLLGRPLLARTGLLQAGGQKAELVTLLRSLLVARARSGERPFTYAEAEQAVRDAAAEQGLALGDFGQPTLWGALDEIAEQNRRHREPPLSVLVVDKDYGLPGRGYFQKHVFLPGTHDTLEQRVFERQLELVRAVSWDRDP